METRPMANFVSVPYAFSNLGVAMSSFLGAHGIFQNLSLKIVFSCCFS